ncbi:MAG TPA: ABC transporter permease subunit [Azospirillaceae bacterium]|nr:ABC transporter permease subunit [Azospirillaceae bacterium]
MGWGRRLRTCLGRWAALAPPYAWLLLFFLVPFAIVLKIALAEAELGAPPYTTLIGWDGDQVLRIRLNLGNFVLLSEDGLYMRALLGSLRTALVSTVLCLLLGYPMAYAIARAEGRWRLVLLMMVVLPFWTSFLIRVYAWMGILRTNGLLNNLLLWLGVVDRPLALLNTDFAVYVGIVYSYLPFMILPLYAALERLDRTLLEAAADLGCRPWQAFVRVTLPLSVPGIVAGSLLVFIPAVGEFVIPELLGGPDTLMIGKVLWTEFSANNDWPLASALAVALLVVLVLPMVVFQAVRARGEAREGAG